MADGGAGKRRAQRDREKAAHLKQLGIERTTGICPNCYKQITVDSRKSRYTHHCK